MCIYINIIDNNNVANKSHIQTNINGRASVIFFNYEMHNLIIANYRIIKK